MCEVETDKATVPFDVLEKGFIAKILLKGDEEVNVGEPVVVIVSKKESIAAFEGYSVGGEGEPKKESTPSPAKKKVDKENPEKQK